MPETNLQTSILAIADLVVRYGAIEALHGVSLHVQRGQIVTLIGANGAGKTTLLRAISGLIPAAAGTITYTSRDSTPAIENQKSKIENALPLHHTPAHRIVAAGLSHVPEGRGVFPNMSVQENLDLEPTSGGTPRKSPPTSNASSSCSPASASGGRSWPAR